MSADHMAPDERLAPLVVCYEQPEWREELLWGLCATLIVALLVVLGKAQMLAVELDLTASARDRWMARATAEDPRPTVRLDGKRFTCEHMNIRREWESAVAAKCEQLAAVLRVARTGR
jgi:hypothetical protein